MEDNKPPHKEDWLRSLKKTDVPYEPITTPEEEEKDLMPVLQRDNDASIQETLKRLKASQNNQASQTTVIGDKVIQTADSLPTEVELNKSANWKKLLIWIIIAIIGGGIILTVASAILNNGSTNIIPINTANNQNRIVRITDPSELATELANLTVAQKTIVLQNADKENSRRLAPESIRAAFATLGLDFDEIMVQNVASSIVIMLDTTADNRGFIVTFGVYDVPNAQKSLRSWEQRSSGFILPNSGSSFSSWQDSLIEAEAYRSNDAVAYTIVEPGIVFIASNPQIINEKRLQVQSLL